MAGSSGWRNVALLGLVVVAAGAMLFFHLVRTREGEAGARAAAGQADLPGDGRQKTPPLVKRAPSDVYVVPRGLPDPEGVKDIVRFERIQDAIAAAGPGCTVHVTKGTYRERLSFPKTGEAGRPMVVEGEEGAVLDAATDEPPDAAWLPAADAGEGVFKRPASARPGLMAWKGRYAPRIAPELMDGEAFEKPGKGAEILAKGPAAQGSGERSFRGIEVLWGFRGGHVYVRFADGRSPKGEDIAFAPESPAIAIEKQDHIQIRNLAVRRAATGVALSKTAGSLVEGCSFAMCERGVSLGEGATCCMVAGNTISLDPAFALDSGSDAGAGPWARLCSLGLDGVCAVLVGNVGDANEVSGNEVRGYWNGVETRGALCTDIGVHFNRFRSVANAALLVAGASSRQRVFGNTVQGSRFGILIDGSGPGQLFVYRNVLHGNACDFRIFGRGAALASVYHNTSVSPLGIEYVAAGAKDAEARRVRFVNNIFAGKRFFAVTGDPGSPPGFGANNDIVSEDAKEACAKYGLEAHGQVGVDPLFEDAGKLDFRPRRDSPAVGKGVRPPPSAGLPDIVPASRFAGDTDIGAIPRSAPGSDGATPPGP